MTHSTPPTWDIFCRVIDNYGDIGVCWRLARQLANEHPVKVRLWVDELAALVKICPEAIITEQQWLKNVDVRLWGESFATETLATVVIEAFACELPASYLATMKHQSPAPLWINLEYLSAETWVESCHGLHSIHPSMGLKKTFFFPGFSKKTGGLLREQDLFIKMGLRTAPEKRAAFIEELHPRISPNSFLVSLFGYENSAISSLLDSWINSPIPVTCLVPESKILPGINRHLSISLKPHDYFQSGSLTIIVLPFLSQDNYDQLLWLCDLNFVRGEDSFVRAQWAGKPLIWHIYPQEENAHLLKLDAFLSHYCQELDAPLQQSIIGLWHSWNRGQNTQSWWNTCMENYACWLKHSNNWCKKLNSLDDLAGKLVQFCEKTL